MRLLARLAAIALVLFVYHYFGSIGRLDYHRVKWDDSFGKPAEGYYASLAEGFLRGQLAMAHTPDPRLAALPDPYDYEARKDIPYLWDASYLDGRYYLYFSPLPALLLYVPYRLIGGGYPHDQFAGVLFGAWAFVLSAMFVWRALAKRKLHVPLPVWLIALGLANVAPYVMTHSRTYEIAILCGAAMSATFAYVLLLYLEKPTTSRLVWCSVWLALAIAARPNLGLLVFVLAVAAWPYTRKSLAAAIVPLAIAAALLLGYNYARFRDPFEFGHRYQLTYMSMEGRHLCGVRSTGEVRRLFNNARLYLLNPPVLEPKFPWVNLDIGALDPNVSFTDVSDHVVGLLFLAPFAVIGSFLALEWRGLEGRDTAGRRPAPQLVVLAGWLALLGLCACWYVSARYELDFWFLISAGAIVCIETRVRARGAAIAIAVLALAACVVATLTAFHGSNNAFVYWNAEEFARWSRIFSGR